MVPKGRELDVSIEHHCTHLSCSIVLASADGFFSDQGVHYIFGAFHKNKPPPSKGCIASMVMIVPETRDHAPNGNGNTHSITYN
jgi:hypothetical protein